MSTIVHSRKIPAYVVPIFWMVTLFFGRSYRLYVAWFSFQCKIWSSVSMKLCDYWTQIFAISWLWSRISISYLIKTWIQYTLCGLSYHAQTITNYSCHKSDFEKIFSKLLLLPRDLKLHNRKNFNTSYKCATKMCLASFL